MKRSHENSEEDVFLAPVAGAIREAFIKEKRALLGNSYMGPGRWDKRCVWLAAARTCVHDLSADPATFVRAAFACSLLSAGPFPNMLYGKAAKRWYREYTSRVKHQCGDALSDETPAQQEDKKALGDLIKSTREIMIRRSGTYLVTPENLNWLCNSFCPAPAYVRILLAYPEDAVKDAYGQEALTFFASHPNIVKAAKNLNYPMDDILQWLM